MIQTNRPANPSENTIVSLFHVVQLVTFVRTVSRFILVEGLFVEKERWGGGNGGRAWVVSVNDRAS